MENGFVLLVGEWASLWEEQEERDDVGLEGEDIESKKLFLWAIWNRTDLSPRKGN